MLFLCYVIHIQAQITPINSHFMLVSEKEMPGTWGEKSEISMLANFRYQWAGIQGSPIYSNILVSSPIPYTKNHGVSIGLNYDQLGAFRITNASLGYNYLVQAKKVKIGIGASISLRSFKLIGNKLITSGGDYEGSVNHNDPILPIDTKSNFSPNLNVGISIIHQLFTQQLSFSDALPTKIKLNDEKLNLKYGMSLQSLTKFNIDVNASLSLEPSMHFITDLRHFQHTLGILMMYKKLIGAGLFVRGYTNNSFESLIPTIRAIPLKNMTIQYSFDATLNGLKSTTSGSHEITLKYDLPKTWIKDYGKAINNPRFL